MTSALKLSVIVPVYKVEQYLPTLLDSILAQTYKDYELLLIDDGSPDGSGKICDDYAAKDERVRVVHKENGGVSSARNRGIEEARGEYLYFCDSDDYIAPDLLEVLMREVGGRDFARITMGPLLKRTAEEFKEKDAERNKTVQCRVVADDEQGVRSGFVLLLTGWTCLVTSLFKRSIIMENNLRFNSKFYRGEDTDFVFRYYCHIHNAVHLDYQGYFYYQNAGSAIHDYRRIVEYDWIQTIEQEWEAIEEHFQIADNKIRKEREYWIYPKMYVDMVASLLKAYQPETSVPRKERIKRWKQIRNDKWFRLMQKANFYRAPMHRHVERCCRSGLFYLADPLLNLLGRRGKLRIRSMKT